MRANLAVTRSVGVKDPDGQVWTVHIARQGDPDLPTGSLSKRYWAALMVNRIRRALVRDHSWEVQLLRGPLDGDWRLVRVQSRELNEDGATDAAVRLAARIQEGT